MGDSTSLSEMEEALKASNECSQRLEDLLQEARDQGTPTPEMTKKLEAANRECHDAMQRYLKAYKAYYDLDPLKVERSS
jgi:hypothetical protein